MSFQKAGIIGLGLIGGSLAKALRSRCGVQNIVAFNRNEDVLLLAKSEGVIDAYSTSIDDVFTGCDIIFLCTPVHTIVDYARLLRPYLSKECILTDVGSTKNQIHQDMQPLLTDVTFIGGHPMTGSERFRYTASKEHLFENAYYILTPENGTEPTLVDAFSSLVSRLGAIPVVVSPPEHDRIVAAISHVPHVMAAALVHTVRELDGPEGRMHLLAAGGFKDITRIASASPDMWEGICLENRTEILRVLDHLGSVLETAKAHIAKSSKTELHEYFDGARIYRDSFTHVTPKSYVKRYEITVDVLDRPGSIAMIAVLFSSHNINIKNMSIVNNREQEHGALFFAFDTQEDREKSIRLLRDMNYEVYVKD